MCLRTLLRPRVLQLIPSEPAMCPFRTYLQLRFIVRRRPVSVVQVNLKQLGSVFTSTWPSTSELVGFELLVATLLSSAVKLALETPALATRVRGEARLVISLLKGEMRLEALHER